MSVALKNHIQKNVPLADSQFAAILPFFQSLDLKKKQNLLNEGQVCPANYFVVKGCLRLFFVNEKGIEQTIQFAIENWWLSDYASFTKQQPSSFAIQAVERSEVLALGFREQDEMLQQCPLMERYFRLIHQRVHAATQFRVKSLYTLSREELYYDFLDHYPEFVQRIPQYLLASFLGFTPEYLSEIRNKKRS